LTQPGPTQEIWRPVAQVADFDQQQSKVFYVSKQEIAVFRVDGHFYAIDNLCPHRQAPLCTGEVSGHVVICPFHGARFDLRNGRGLKGPHQTDIGHYEVKVDGDVVKLKL